MSTLKEVENAVKIIIKNKNDKIIIHHCPSGYPAKLENINLNIIKTLKKRFDFPIGFSDHSPGYSMDVAAVSLGANLVEKTITKSRNTKSVEHMFSLEYNEMNEFVNLIKNLKTCLGKFTRPLHNQEKKNRLMSRRSIFLDQDASKGDYIKNRSLSYRRPEPEFQLIKSTKLKIKN